MTWPPPKSEPRPAKGVTGKASDIERPAPAEPEPSMDAKPADSPGDGAGDRSWLLLLVVGAVLLLIGWKAPENFLSHLTVFVLACFVGWQVVWNVAPALHTPLMSVTNAISGIILIGGMLQVSGEAGTATTVLGAAAVLLATVNIAGGFLVTRRMLAMFSR